ncbi:uncharacterized protein LOC141906397 [Tubulanus polymorphus]|uniref:uncharacterized protein LOC141906397 n=1 Tax=Tubulanus polymorphus TaxID=672921 RepID=UPI003DA662F4
MLDVKGHKHFCKFRYCNCYKCLLLTERKRIVAAQIALKRACDNERLREPKSAAGYLALNHNEQPSSTDEEEIVVDSPPISKVHASDHVESGPLNCEIRYNPHSDSTTSVSWTNQIQKPIAQLPISSYGSHLPPQYVDQFNFTHGFNSYPITPNTHHSYMFIDSGGHPFGQNSTHTKREFEQQQLPWNSYHHISSLPLHSTRYDDNQSMLLQSSMQFERYPIDQQFERNSDEQQNNYLIKNIESMVQYLFWCDHTISCTRFHITILLKVFSMEFEYVGQQFFAFSRVMAVAVVHLSSIKPIRKQRLLCDWLSHRNQQVVT